MVNTSISGTYIIRNRSSVPISKEKKAIRILADTHILVFPLMFFTDNRQEILTVDYIELLFRI
jgi:hypothetical protein